MHLVQLFLPLADNEGVPFPAALHARTREELLQRFGGVTAYSRAPASGLWEEGGHVDRDELLVMEVMVKRLERPWWRAYRQQLERRFAQRELLMRAHAIERL